MSWLDDASSTLSEENFFANSVHLEITRNSVATLAIRFVLGATAVLKSFSTDVGTSITFVVVGFRRSCDRVSSLALSPTTVKRRRSLIGC